MLYPQAEKSVMLIYPQSCATDATLTGNVDCRGFKYLSVDVLGATQASTTDAPTCLKLTECDTTVASSFAAITALTGGTDTGNFTIPASVTNAPTTAGLTGGYGFRFLVDLTKRKRYLKLSFTAGVAAQIVAAQARLSRAEDMPDSTTDAGLAGWIRG